MKEYILLLAQSTSVVTFTFAQLKRMWRHAAQTSSECGLSGHESHLDVEPDHPGHMLVPGGMQLLSLHHLLVLVTSTVCSSLLTIMSRQ